MHVLKSKRIRGLTATLALILGLSLAEQAAYANDPCSPCNDQDPAPGNGGGDPGWDTKHPKWGPPYCTDPDYPNHVSEVYPIYKRNNGQTEGPENLAPLGPIRTHQLVAHWCNDPTGKIMAKYDVFWMPLVDPDTIIFNRDLLAQVQKDLEPAKLFWTNLDEEYHWLWVNVEHFAAIEPIDEIFVDDKAGDEVTGEAYAFIRAWPVEFTLSIPGLAGADGVVECDLTLVQTAGGCPITFSHSSSIDPSGEFTLQTRLVYEVDSNSGKYKGLRFTREGTATIAVAEAMAVSRDSSR